jgi:hypothetical protein
VEFYLNTTGRNGWVTADATNDSEGGYGWYDWDACEDYFQNKYHWDKGSYIDVESVRWVYNAIDDNVTTEFGWDDNCYVSITYDVDDETDED